MRGSRLVRKIVLLTTALSLVLGVGVGAMADESDDLTPRQVARQAAVEAYMPMVRPDHKRVVVRVSSCRPAGRWRACHVLVRGVSVCRGVIRVRPRAGVWLAWSPRMVCR